MSFNLAHLNWTWNRILNNGFSRGILKGDSQGGFSRWILKGGFSRWILKNLIFGHPSLGNPGFEVLEILVLIRYPPKSSFGGQKVMNLGIQKRRGTQLRAGWSDSQPVSSVLGSIYPKSVDLQNDPYRPQPVILQQACALDSGGTQEGEYIQSVKDTVDGIN